MVVLTVMYPSDAWFDEDYYFNQHMPMVNRLWGDAVVKAQMVRGVVGLDGGKPPFRLVALVWVRSMEELERLQAEHGATIAADIPRYTDGQAIVQISEEA